MPKWGSSVNQDDIVLALGANDLVFCTCTAGVLALVLSHSEFFQSQQMDLL
jgi:hypothetical protein